MRFDKLLPDTIWEPFLYHTVISKAIKFLVKILGGDESLAGEAAYRLGLAYIKMSDAKTALMVGAAVVIYMLL